MEIHNQQTNSENETNWPAISFDAATACRDASSIMASIATRGILVSPAIHAFQYTSKGEAIALGTLGGATIEGNSVSQALVKEIGAAAVGEATVLLLAQGPTGWIILGGVGAPWLYKQILDGVWEMSTEHANGPHIIMSPWTDGNSPTPGSMVIDNTGVQGKVPQPTGATRSQETDFATQGTAPGTKQDTMGILEGNKPQGNTNSESVIEGSAPKSGAKVVDSTGAQEQDKTPSSQPRSAETDSVTQGAPPKEKQDTTGIIEGEKKTNQSNVEGQAQPEPKSALDYEQTGPPTPDQKPASLTQSETGQMYADAKNHINFGSDANYVSGDHAQAAASGKSATQDNTSDNAADIDILFKGFSVDPALAPEGQGTQPYNSQRKIAGSTDPFKLNESLNPESPKFKSDSNSEVNPQVVAEMNGIAAGLNLYSCMENDNELAATSAAVNLLNSIGKAAGWNSSAMSGLGVAGAGVASRESRKLNNRGPDYPSRGKQKHEGI